MIKITILFLAVICSSFIYSQNGWQQINPGFGQSYNSVHFADANTGMACGQGGVIIKTTNGGLNWFNQVTGFALNLNDVRMFSGSVAIACGDNQTIIRTTNSGVNWAIVNQGSPPNNSIVNLNIHSGGTATAYSQYYLGQSEYTYLYKSSDMGLTWQTSQTYVPNRWIHFINLNTGWAYGTTYLGPPINQYYLDVNKTVNGGQNWTLTDRGSGISINAGMIYFYDALVGFRYSYLASVYLSRSVTGGSSWTGITIPGFNSMIRSFHFASTQIGWFVGDNSTIYFTSNSGANWVQQISPVTANLKEIYFVDENTGWIAASSQGILKTTNGGTVTGISIIGSAIPDKFSLFQNYPNPFNPSTEIKFDISEGSFVTLNVYDMLGREINRLVNEELKPGTYQADWDASNQTSGVYFYKLTAGDFTETKRMVLIK